MRKFFPAAYMDKIEKRIAKLEAKLLLTGKLPEKWRKEVNDAELVIKRSVLVRATELEVILKEQSDE